MMFILDKIILSMKFIEIIGHYIIKQSTSRKYSESLTKFRKGQKNIKRWNDSKKSVLTISTDFS